MDRLDLVDEVELLLPRCGSRKDVRWRHKIYSIHGVRSVHQVKLYLIGNEHLAKMSCALMHIQAYSSSFQKNLDDSRDKQ